MSAALVDTSVWIAREVGREIDLSLLPETLFVSVVTLGELQAGVLAAADTATRSQRLETVSSLAAIQPLPIDETVAAQWAQLRVRLHEAGRRMNVNDLWIAATALVHHLPVLTQDADFDVLAEIGALEIIRV